MTPEPDRRSFLGWAICGLVAIFSVVLGVPLVCYFIDPRNRRAPKSDARLVDGIKLNDLHKDQPVQGVIRDARSDGWTFYPDDVLGRVWVVQIGAKPDLSNPAAFNAKPMADKEKYLLVFTTICPHLGCSVNVDADKGFACPCHNAVFKFDGTKVSGPQQRGMDTLEWEVDPANVDRIRVKYQKFEASKAEKNLV